jgi:uncharacterized protein YcnI
MKTIWKIALPFAATMALTGSADAHVGLTGPAFAGANFLGTFTVGHGCNGDDTYSVEITIPAGVTSVRALDSTFGKAVVHKDSGGAVTSVSWTKSVADVVAEDVNYYTVSIRMRMPSTPFTTLYFPTVQTCRDELGNISETHWIGTGNEPANPDGAPPPEPAPSITLLPSRVPGWNRYTVPVELTSLSLFNDAEIVWAGSAAYSVNPNYKALITAEPGTTELTSIPASTEIWVKY